MRFKTHTSKPTVFTMPHHDLLVIGGGPAGYIGAIRAAQHGLNVACVEKEKQLGGTCLRVGCIPSKAMLESSHLYEQATESMADRGIVAKSVNLDLGKMHGHRTGTVDKLAAGIGGLFKKNKVTHYKGLASFNNANSVTISGSKTEEVTADKFLICTGSEPSSLPGIEFDGDVVGSSTDALQYDPVPKKLVVIGAGYIGLELGTVWRRLGSEVIVLEYLDRILPGMDAELAREAMKIAKAQGIEFRLGTKVTGVKKTKKGAEVQIEGADPVACDKVLMAVGRRPNTDGLNVEAAGIQLTDRGFVKTDAHWKTSADNVWAVGDVIGGPMLAHKAEEEGVACIDHIVTGYGHIDYDIIPGVVYTHPEIATIGKTEEQLKESGVPYKKGKFPFMASGRAQAMNDTDGFIKVLAHEETDRILGVHMIGAHTGELIAEAGAAMAFGASAEDVASVCHAHPTLAEAFKEACLAVDGKTLNF